MTQVQLECRTHLGSQMAAQASFSMVAATVFLPCPGHCRVLSTYHSWADILKHKMFIINCTHACTLQIEHHLDLCLVERNTCTFVNNFLQMFSMVSDLLLVSCSGLPPSGSWQDLKDHMREAGDVCYADVFRDGTGVVEFVRKEDMTYAVRKLDNTKFRSHEVGFPLMF